MKLLLTALLLLPLVTGAQLWKNYSDSAKTFLENKNSEQALAYLDLAKKELPKDSAVSETYSSICSRIGGIYFGQGQYRKTEPLYLEVKNISEKLYGKKHISYISACNNLGVLYRVLGEFPKAESNALEAQGLIEEVFGKEHLNYANSCNTLGTLYLSQGAFDKTEPLFLQTMEIRKKLLGEHPDYATICNNLAILYVYTGRHEKAETFYIESKRIRLKTLGENHPDYAASCNNLGDLNITLGRLSTAESLLLEALKIRERELGKKHPDYGATCNNVARLYREMGDYEKAESFYLAARENIGQRLGKNHPSYATVSSNLALVYNDLGFYKKSEELLLESKKIIEAKHGKDHPSYAEACNNLGGLYRDLKEFDKAENYYKEASSITEKNWGTDDPEYPRIIGNLGILYHDKEDYANAEKNFLRSRELFEKLAGKEHVDYAQTTHALAVLYRDMGQFEKAEPLYIESKAILERTMGRDHPEYLTVVNNIAYYYWSRGDFKKARDFYREAFDKRYELANKVFRFTSEKEQELFMLKNKSDNSYVQSFLFASPDAGHKAELYDISVRSRNMILSNLRRQRGFVHSSGDTASLRLLNEWLNNKEQLSSWYLRPIAERTEKFAELETLTDQQEKELARRSTVFDTKQNEGTSWTKIKNALGPKDAAIEFVEIPYYNGLRWTDSIFYAALLLRSNKPAPELVQLFEKKQFDSTIRVTRARDLEASMNLRYSGNNALYKLIWKPLETKLSDVETIYFSASGVLHNVSLAALPINATTTVSDRYKLVQLNTTSSILENAPSSIASADKILLYGGVLYDGDTTALRQAARQYTMKSLAGRSISENEERGNIWQYLTESKTEVEAIRKLAEEKKFAVKLHTGWDATEESFKAINGGDDVQILHIATHGFFFPDPKSDRSTATEGRAFRFSDNILLRSGLTMAGANFAWNGKPVEGIEDGILTAYEVADLYLPKTKLAVLSACETGLGEIQGSEGVYGLQRAFKMAGIQHLIMSLWKVDDLATSEFMQAFYKNLFERKNIPEAFKFAQTFMKNKYRNEPYKWAAWVLVR